MDNRYGEYFGFIPVEVESMAEYYGVPDNSGLTAGGDVFNTH